MGFYIEVDGRENNSKSISYPMLEILQELFPEKTLDYGEMMMLNPKEVALVAEKMEKLLDDERLFQSYVDEHSQVYGIKDKSDEYIRNTFSEIKSYFADTLVSMVLYNRMFIFCNMV